MTTKRDKFDWGMAMIGGGLFIAVFFVFGYSAGYGETVNMLRLSNKVSGLMTGLAITTWGTLIKTRAA